MAAAKKQWVFAFSMLNWVFTYRQRRTKDTNKQVENRRELWPEDSRYLLCECDAVKYILIDLIKIISDKQDIDFIFFDKLFSIEDDKFVTYLICFWNITCIFVHFKIKDSQYCSSCKFYQKEWETQYHIGKRYDKLSVNF